MQKAKSTKVSGKAREQKASLAGRGMRDLEMLDPAAKKIKGGRSRGTRKRP